MKKLIFILVVIAVFLPATVFGHDFSMGVKAGVGFPHFRGESYQDELDYLTDITGDTAKTRTMLGFTGGVFFTIGISDFFAIQTEVNYMRGGGSYGWGDVNDINSNNAYRIKEYFDAIEIPLLLKFRFGYNHEEYYEDFYLLPPVSFNIFAGPSVTFIYGDVKQSLDSIYEPFQLEVILPSASINKVYYSAVFGVSVDIPIYGDMSIILDGRYVLGLTSIMNEYYFYEYVYVEENNLLLTTGISLRVF